MFQTFDAQAAPEQGPPRLAALREVLRAEGLDGFIVPRADAYQGEYTAERDARLPWLTGFTGSAGFAAVLLESAGIFVDGRYRAQVRAQVASVFTPVPWPQTRLAPWLKDQLPQGGRVGYDPWLQTIAEAERRRAALDGTGIVLVPVDNLVDRIWDDQPPAPIHPVHAHPLELAGTSSADKRKALAEVLRSAGQSAAVLTMPDSIMWLLNIRGSDIPRNPLAHGFAILHDTARVDLFMDAAKLTGLTDHLGPDVTQHATTRFATTLAGLTGKVRIERSTAPEAVATTLGDRADFGPDPCALPKARKAPAEITGTIAAHLRDGAAVTRHLAWLDAQPPGSITEIDVVTHLEQCRRADNSLRDISFDTIAGSGPNGAIIHYRVTHATNRTLTDGDLLVLDSGGQYPDGTTDITRTLAIGTPGAEEQAAYTAVLRGMIAMSRLVWSKGLAGRDIEAVARAPLWEAGQDFNHGTGHGVGAYLCVHEGPQRLSHSGQVPLEPGMILSIEPGYYREEAFGIRIENLAVVETAEIDGADPGRAFLRWRTLTRAPINTRLILPDRLTAPERDWLNAYHKDVAHELSPLLGEDQQEWLRAATAAI